MCRKVIAKGIMPIRKKNTNIFFKSPDTANSMKPTYGERVLKLTVAVVVENSGLENTFLNPEWKARCWAGVFQFPSWLQVPYLLRFYSKTKATLTQKNFRPLLWKLKPQRECCY